jgi:hypothetical protein
MEDLNKNIRHYHPIELTNIQRLETAALMDQLRDVGILPKNINLGRFINECYSRGLNDYRKDLSCFD